MTTAWRIYRGLAEAFPHEFKLAYGDEMMQAGEDAMRQIAKRHGVGGMVRLIVDIALRLPVEYASEMQRDLRFAARALWRSRGFALVGIVSMGLGMGLTTNVYSSGWALFTRPLAGATHASRLAVTETPVSYPYLEHYREQRELFAGVAAVEPGVEFNIGLQAQARPERVFGQIVSPDYFEVLGVSAAHGRMFSPQMDKPGDAPAVIISNRFWRSRLNADPTAVGQILRVNGQTATIVGITPRKFEGALTTNPAEIFVPTTAPVSMVPELENDALHDRHAKQFLALICLQPGAKIAQAEAALDGITRRLDKDDSAAPGQADTAKRVTLLFAGTRVPIPREAKPAVLGFFGALMVIVMAIACLNLATMLMARGANRRQELAIRLGVGASRFRLVRQMVTEGILLSLLGGAAGFVLAYGLLTLNSHVQMPPGAPLSPDVSVDWHAAVFTFVLAVVCGVGFSLMPALTATKTDVAPALKEGSALRLSGHRRFGVRNLAMAAQVAGSLLLLLVTGFLVLGILRGNSLHTNFNQKTMGFLSIDPVRDGYTPEKAESLFARLPDRLRATSTLRSFALTAQPPFQEVDDDDGFRLTVKDPHQKTPVQVAVAMEKVGAGYFAALAEPLVAGREFNEQDERADIGQAAGAENDVPTPLILNQKAARKFFGDGTAIGQQLQNGRDTYVVVGTVPDLKGATGMTEAEVYVPLTQRDFARPPAGGITIIARSDTAAHALAGMRSAVTSLDPNLTVFNGQTLSEYLELMRYAMRSALRTFGGIGLFGLVLSSIGLAGVTAYAVAQRRKEIGIRMALGATRRQVLGLVLREGMVLIGTGTAVGFLSAMALAKGMGTITTAFSDAFEVGTGDPRLLLGAPLLLAGLALLACYVPARRATSIDPLKALREE
jgi:macrolide transport system ATP-binding/permease protein